MLIVEKIFIIIRILDEDLASKIAYGIVDPISLERFEEELNRNSIIESMFGIKPKNKHNADKQAKAYSFTYNDFNFKNRNKINTENIPNKANNKVTQVETEQNKLGADNQAQKHYTYLSNISNADFKNFQYNKSSANDVSNSIVNLQDSMQNEGVDSNKKETKQYTTDGNNAYYLNDNTSNNIRNSSSQYRKLVDFPKKNSANNMIAKNKLIKDDKQTNDAVNSYKNILSQNLNSLKVNYKLSLIKPRSSINSSEELKNINHSSNSNDSRNYYNTKYFRDQKNDKKVPSCMLIKEDEVSEVDKDDNTEKMLSRGLKLKQVKEHIKGDEFQIDLASSSYFYDNSENLYNKKNNHDDKNIISVSDSDKNFEKNKISIQNQKNNSKVINNLVNYKPSSIIESFDMDDFYLDINNFSMPIPYNKEKLEIKNKKSPPAINIDKKDELLAQEKNWHKNMLISNESYNKNKKRPSMNLNSSLIDRFDKSKNLNTCNFEENINKVASLENKPFHKEAIIDLTEQDNILDDFKLYECFIEAEKEEFSSYPKAEVKAVNKFQGLSLI